EEPSPLPEGPTVLSRLDCQERARRTGRLGSASVAGWRLERRAREMSLVPEGSRYTLKEIHKTLVPADAHAVAPLRMDITRVLWEQHLADLALAVDCAYWRLGAAQQVVATLRAWLAEDPTGCPAEQMAQAEAGLQEAQAHLAALLGLDCTAGARLV